MTTVDGNGVAFVETTDAISPINVLLNTLQTSTSNALGSFARPFIVANLAARATLAAAWAPTASKPLYVYRADAAAGRQQEFTTDGSTWTPVVPWTTIKEWDYTTGLTVNPSTTYTASTAITLADVPIGAMVSVEMRLKLRNNGTTVQTTDITPTISGLTGAWPRGAPAARYPGGSDVFDTNQLLKGTFVASSATPSVTPKILVGAGTPAIIAYSFYVEMTVLPASAARQTTAGV